MGGGFALEEAERPDAGPVPNHGDGGGARQDGAGRTPSSKGKKDAKQGTGVVPLDLPTTLRAVFYIEPEDTVDPAAFAKAALSDECVRAVVIENDLVAHRRNTLFFVRGKTQQVAEALFDLRFCSFNGHRAHGVHPYFLREPSLPPGSPVAEMPVLAYQEVNASDELLGRIEQQLLHDPVFQSAVFRVHRVHRMENRNRLLAKLSSADHAAMASGLEGIRRIQGVRSAPPYISIKPPGFPGAPMPEAARWTSVVKKRPWEGDDVEIAFLVSGGRIRSRDMIDAFQNTLGIDREKMKMVASETDVLLILSRRRESLALEIIRIMRCPVLPRGAWPHEVHTYALAKIDDLQVVFQKSWPAQAFVKVELDPLCEPAGAAQALARELQDHLVYVRRVLNRDRILALIGAATIGQLSQLVVERVQPIRVSNAEPVTDTISQVVMETEEDRGDAVPGEGRLPQGAIKEATREGLEQGLEASALRKFVGSKVGRSEDEVRDSVRQARKRLGTKR